MYCAINELVLIFRRASPRKPEDYIFWFTRLLRR